MAAQSEKGKKLIEQIEKAQGRLDEVYERYCSVRDMKPVFPTGKLARDQALDELGKQRDKINVVIAKLEEDLEVAEIEHLSDLTATSSDEKK